MTMSLTGPSQTKLLAALLSTSHSPFETFHWLCVYMVVKLMRTEANICSLQNVLTGSLLVTDFTNLCKHI